jgi:hypothetical protein
VIKVFKSHVLRRRGDGRFIDYVIGKGGYEKALAAT